MPIFLQIIFPAFGILLIAYASSTFLFPFGEELRGKMQHFDGLGIKMDISVVTLIILVGLVFSGIGLYSIEYSYKQKYQNEENLNALSKDSINKLAEQVFDEQNIINYFKAQTITYQFVLDGEINDKEPLDIRSLVCVYNKYWQQGTDSIIYAVFPGPGPNSVKVIFNNLSEQEISNTTPRITIIDKRRKKKWSSPSFNPLVPTIFLKSTN